MGDTKSSRLMLERIPDSNFRVPMVNRKLSPKVTPQHLKVHKLPIGTYTTEQEVAVASRELGDPSPDRGISRPWPFTP